MNAKYCISDYVDKFNSKLMKIRDRYGMKNLDGIIKIVLLQAFCIFFFSSQIY